MHSIYGQIYKQVLETYIDALMTASFLTPNLGGGLTTTALPPPVFLASLILELLAGRVVPVPFGESATVEGTLVPTTASSPDAVVCGILAAGLKKKKNQSQGKQIETKILDYNQLATYIVLVVCEEL